MPRKWNLRIEDMLDAIAKIQRYTDGMTFEEFCKDEKTIDAVLHNIELIGEAAGHVSEEIRTRYPAFPWAEMRGMRNILAHAYFRVSLPIVWQAAVVELPPLVPLLQEIYEGTG